MKCVKLKPKGMESNCAIIPLREMIISRYGKEAESLEIEVIEITKEDYKQLKEFEGF